jgi:DNA-binding NtrC family response regulator
LANTSRPREASVSGHIEQGHFARYARVVERLNAILVIDDKPEVHQAVALALEPWVARVESAESPEAVPALMAATRYDCALLDMNFAAGERSGREGIEALDMIKAADPTLAVILMTAYGAVSLAVESLKRGANDFLLKPWRNEALVAAVHEAAGRTETARAGTSLDALERSAIAGALDRHDGNIAQAAAALGLSRPALYRRMAKHGL